MEAEQLQIQLQEKDQLIAELKNQILNLTNRITELSNNFTAFIETQKKQTNKTSNNVQTRATVTNKNRTKR